MRAEHEARCLPKNQWMLIGLIGCYVAPALLLWPATYLGMLGDYAAQMLVIPIILALVIPVAALIANRGDPLGYIATLARRTLPRFAAVAAVFCAGVAAFTTYKLSIPQLVPFYADPLFADLDLALHGVNPGEWVHSVVPDFLLHPLVVAYGTVWFMLWFGLLAFVALSEDKALRYRYFWSMALSMILLGTICAVLMSSVGPIFYDRFYPGQRFLSLTSLIEDSALGEYMTGMTGYLYDNYRDGTSALGTGISAMPSMHLAIATLNALMLSKVSRVLGAGAVAYLVAILLGSVLLGWHYAIDGYFSILAVSAIWIAVGRMLGVRVPRQRHSTSPAPDGEGVLASNTSA